MYSTALVHCIYRTPSHMMLMPPLTLCRCLHRFMLTMQTLRNTHSLLTPPSVHIPHSSQSRLSHSINYLLRPPLPSRPRSPSSPPFLHHHHHAPQHKDTNIAIPLSIAKVSNSLSQQQPSPQLSFSLSPRKGHPNPLSSTNTPTSCIVFHCHSPHPPLFSCPSHSS